MKSSSKISIVIGSNYGDEGKGVVTSLLASSINKSEKNDSEKYVILSHGGMQRGHTAYTKDGTFVNYHALSSATHLGWNTVYGENFVFNLPIFYNESSISYLMPIALLDLVLQGIGKLYDSVLQKERDCSGTIPL